MKAIIVAAGMSNRLQPLTKDDPKCMLKVGNKTVMQWQLEALRQCGVDDIVVVRGYKKERIAYPGIRYYENSNYRNNNILRSLFYAENEMDDGFVFSYSDILYGKDVVSSLLKSRVDIGLVVDVDWAERYEGRTMHPVEQAELVAVEDDKIVKIGKGIDPNITHGEFIGLAKFSREGAEILRSNYKRVADRFRNKCFHDAPSIEKAYLTDMIQELVDRGYPVYSVDIHGGWFEIDTDEDLQNARRRWIR